MKYKTQTIAIRAMCSQCIYDNAGLGNGTELEQITACTSPDCPLFEYRPLDKKHRDIIKQARIDAMTPEEKTKYDEKCKLAGERLRENLGRDK